MQGSTVEAMANAVEGERTHTQAQYTGAPVANSTGVGITGIGTMRVSKEEDPSRSQRLSVYRTKTGTTSAPQSATTPTQTAGHPSHLWALRVNPSASPPSNELYNTSM